MPSEDPSNETAPNSLTASSQRARWHLALAWLVFALYVGLIEYWLGWGGLLAPWWELDVGAVVTALLLFLLTYAVRAHRLFDYFRDSMRGGWLVGLRLMVYHNALNSLLPMRSGELSFPLLMKRYFAVDYAHSLPALLWFRLLDLHTILLVGGVMLLGQRWHWAATSVVALLWLALPYMAFAARGALRALVAKAPMRRVSAIACRALDGLPRTQSTLWSSWLLTWLNWLVKLVVLAWVLTQFVEVGSVAALLGAAGGELASVLPFHAPGGVGTYEAGIVAVLVPFGIAARPALNAAVNAHLFVLGSALASAALALLIPRQITADRGGGCGDGTP
jgi:uncharacterized membrane protein YbhN (UPF0104 family)